MKGLTLLSLLALLLYGCSQSRNQSNFSEEKSSEKIRKLNVEKITHNLSGSVDNISNFSAKRIVSEAYKTSFFTPNWSNGDTLYNASKQFIKALAGSKGYGLVRNYNGLLLQKLSDSLQNIALGHQSKSDILFQIEFLLSQNGIQFIADLKYGFTEIDSSRIVNKIDSLTEKDIAFFFNSPKRNNADSLLSYYYSPQHPAAKELLKGLQKFVTETELSDHYDYMIPNYKQDSATAYRVAHQALKDHGFIDEKEIGQDSVFWKALIKFQEVNGLKGDCKIGNYTRDALNTSNYERFLMAVMTLERWKNFELNGESNYILVNVPGYELTYYKNNKAFAKHRVVVGAPDTHTPSFSAKLKYLNINPQWHVPYSISSKEILPYLKRDSAYLSSKGYKLYNSDHELVDENSVDWSSVSQNNFNYKIVQNSGSYNSLGILAFMFPNEHAVFIHDTPSKIFFNSDVRAFSHGCVRLQNPIDLAGILLESDGHLYNKDSVNAMISRRKEERIYLKTPITVYISYFTVQVKNGELVFHRDIYDRDKKLRSELRSFIEKSPDHIQTL